MQQTATPRSIADGYVETLADLNPILATYLGTRPGSDALPDLSPDGHAAQAEADRAALAELDATEAAAAAAAGGLPPAERRAARLLRERLTTALAHHDAGEHLLQLNNLFSPVQQLRNVFLVMPAATPDDWAVIARRLRNLPAAILGYTASLDEGTARGLTVAPRQIETVIDQLTAWLDADWFRTFAAGAPDAAQTAELRAAAALATTAFAELRAHLRDRYLPAAAGTPDAAGRDRYLLGARQWLGADLDPEEAYAYGWAEYHRLAGEMREVAEQVLPGGTPQAAMRHLEEHGPAVEGEAAIRAWLQELMDRAIDELDGTHFDLAEPIRTVEAMIAPPGSAAAPYYTRPSVDFTRPGRTWLPTMGRTRFPLWWLVSTWYHEGVPGHHLQLATWAHEANGGNAANGAGRLSRYQANVGVISASAEGWALYAERLMDELGYLTDPAHRLGYLSAQMMRAVRVIIDIGMHLRLRIPGGEAFHAGERWTPELGRAFFAGNSGHDDAFVDSEIVRYLGRPAQAISYKLGERAWLAAREAARAAAAARGEAFDLRSWHMAALSLGSLGLADLAEELRRVS